MTFKKVKAHTEAKDIVMEKISLEEFVKFWDNVVENMTKADVAYAEGNAFNAKVKKSIVGPGNTCADGKCFVEVSLAPTVDVKTLKVAPHGLIGQSYDGDDIGVIGILDDYKPDKDGVITTSAMGEGAIEGVATDYEMASKFATAFKFSRWGKTEAKPRPSHL